jgi:2-oxoacid:acceptor oxidoreductase delta subunit (pyruvate/2-ketoisovalerate family)
VQVGKNPAWDELKRFDAVFLATGARVAPSLGLPGDDLPQIQSGLDFLRKVNTGGSAELGRRVVVVGGNSLALDCARAALRLGAAPLVVFAGRREEMTATPQEIEEALAEGVRFEFQAKPVELQTEPHAENEPALDAIRSMYAEGAEAGAGQHLSGLECLRTGPTGDGADSDHFILPVDAVLVAESPKLQFGYLPSGVAADGGGVTVDDFGATARSAFFAGGALAEGTRDVAHAIGSGKRAAIGIDRYLRERAGETLKPADPAALRYGKRGNLSMTRWRGDDPIVRTGEVNEVVLFEQLNMAHFQPVPRNPDRQRSLKERRNGFAEANLGLTRAEALAEARRCFNCGVCNQCELCLIFCPDVAIKRHGERAGFSISYKYCKGCGVCVEECPRGAITMTREGL